MEEKKFNLAEIVLLVMIGLANDAAQILVDLMVFVPVVGWATGGLFELFDVVVSGIILFWFIMKLGFGAPAFVQLAGSLGEMVGIPGRTVSVVIGIIMVNNPKAKQVASMAAPAAGGLGAASGVAAEGAAVAGAEGAALTEAREAAGAGKAALPAGKAEEKTATGRPSQAQGEKTLVEQVEAESEAGPEAGSGSEISEEAFGMPREPWEKVRDIMEELPEPGSQAEREAEEVPRPVKVVDISSRRPDTPPRPRGNETEERKAA